MTGTSLLIGYLALFRPPAFPLWYIRLGVTEWGYWLAPLLLLPLVGPARRLLGWASWPLGAAVLLACAPLLQAQLLARTLPTQLDDAFGQPVQREPATRSPLVAADLFRGIAVPQVAHERLVYAERDGRQLSLDLYAPERTASASAAPLVVVIHGGSWQSGDSTQLAALNHYLVAQGYAVAALNYRLAPQHPFPAARDDVVAALAFLKENAPAHGIDAGRIVLLGRSAGAQLALLAAYTAADPAIRGVVSFYGPTDLIWGYDHPVNPAVLDSQGTLEAYLSGSPEQVRETYLRASPTEAVGPTTPPTLLIHGAMDEMVFLENSERLAARLAEAGRPHLLLALPWASHAADANLNGPSGQLSTYAIARFLAAVM
ncbi:MAG: alpha/beta hydrolase [Roseiflexaceae bacterium]|nr:alpha/beta hydrolase [Roseiflexaceae bacterium]